MKIKIDFVTNSSSTSFCGFGIRFYEDELKEALQDISLMLPKNNNDRDNFYGLLDEITKKYNLTWACNYTTYYMGIEFQNSKMDVTLNEIQNKVRKAIDEIGIKKTAEFIEVSWYDG
jgi:hypothetical protein